MPIGFEKYELKKLVRCATVVVIWLAICLVGCVGTLAYLLTYAKHEEPLLYILISIVGGGLGSSVSALMSVAERVSHGWESRGGYKFPKEGKEDKFVAKMIPIFCIRPLFGATMGIVLYLGIEGGFLLALESPKEVAFSNEGLAFLSVLIGIFAKTFLEKLRAAFDVLFGKK